MSTSGPVEHSSEPPVEDAHAAPADSSPVQDGPDGPVTRVEVVQPKSKVWREWLTFGVGVLGLLAIVGSFRVFFLVMDSSRMGDQRSRYEAISAKLLDLDSTFIQHPQLTPYFWNGQSADNVDETTKRTIEAIATQRVDYDGYAYTELFYMGTAGDGSFKTSDLQRPTDYPVAKWDTWVSWSETFLEQFHNSPAMCAIVTDPNEQRSYNVRFIRALRDSQACPNFRESS